MNRIRKRQNSQHRKRVNQAAKKRRCAARLDSASEDQRPAMLAEREATQPSALI